eukprot:3150261-Alexandrium_andersonii.AAC.1
MGSRQGSFLGQISPGLGAHGLPDPSDMLACLPPVGSNALKRRHTMGPRLARRKHARRGSWQASR